MRKLISLSAVFFAACCAAFSQKVYTSVSDALNNTSDVTVTISATLTVGKTTRTQKWELKPKESKTLTASVKVDEDKQVKATVSATVEGHDCGSKSSTVSLKKI